MDLVDLLHAGVSQGASDIHITAGMPPLVRVRGQMVPLGGYDRVIDDASLTTALTELLNANQRTHLAQNLDLDFSFGLPGVGRFRVNVHLHTGGFGAVFRVIPQKIPTPEEIGLTPAILKLAHLPRGLVLLTGPTGSGKTTTLACLVSEMLKTSRKHLLTIEDPIEFVYQSERCRITQREVGRQARSFAGALRAAMRQDPDVILVGEMRDPETISMALTAAETGHLVFSTLHTSGAAQSLHRILDVFPPGQQGQIRAQLAGTLKAVITQTLLRRADGNGRIAAREVMLQTPGISNMIREGQVHQMDNVLFSSSEIGMCTLDQDLARLVRLGAVAMEEAESLAVDPDILRKMSFSGGRQRGS